MKTPIPERIQSLRLLMEQYGADACIIPSADPHQSEYVPTRWKSRAWISGFSGSAGTVAVLKDKAGLWTDGRYFIQAEQELSGSGIDLFRMQMPDVPELIDWLVEQVPEGGTVALDGRQLSAQAADEWREKLASKHISLRIDLDPVSTLWTDRPALPDIPVLLHPKEYAGRSAREKLQEIRALMTEQQADRYLVASLDDIAWLFNIRGGDIQHCPVVSAYALVDQEEATLFLNPAKVDESTRETLLSEGISVLPYDRILEELATLPESASVLLDARRVNALLRQTIPAGCNVIQANELTALPKARKNNMELKQWGGVQELDGAAMVRFWKWLETAVPKGDVTEYSAAERLEAIRRSSAACRDLSFVSISAYGPNAAMMHYAPTPERCASLAPSGFYLIDSGGQYFGGTTDITRTFALGPLSDEQRIDYTLVLKGVINLSRARFLKGSAGNNLDILARQPLWEHGIDYKCGTGHGVGYYLNVHEGPQNFSQHKKSDTPLEPGMILTIEPGVYKEGRHGIRTENMVVVEEDRETESGTFYRFRTLTLCPIDTSPLKLEMLTPAEIIWIDEYHQVVRKRLSAHLQADEAAWLDAKTQPIGR